MYINLNDDDIMDAKTASKIWGKNEAYVRSAYKQNPQKFPKGTIRKLGSTWIVTTQGMEAITGIKDPRKQLSKHSIVSAFFVLTIKEVKACNAEVP